VGEETNLIRQILLRYSSWKLTQKPMKAEAPRAKDKTSWTYISLRPFEGSAGLYRSHFFFEGSLKGSIAAY